MSAISELINQLCPNGVEYKTLGETCARHHGTMITAGRMAQLSTDDGDVRVFAAGSTVANIPSAEIPANDVIREPGVIVKSRGYIGFEFCDCPFTHKNELWSYTVKDNGVDLKFVYYYLQTRVGTLQKLSRSKSVKLPQLATGDTDKLEIPVPPLPVQQEIVRRLDAMTGLIEDLEKELAARQKLYEWVREETFKQLEAEGVERKRLGEMVSVKSAPLKVNRTEYCKTGIYPIVDQGQSFVAGYTDYEDAVIVGGPYVIFGDHTREVKYVDFPFAQGADGVKILCSKNGVDARYLYYAVSALKINSRGYNRHWPIASRLDILLPVSPVQRKIVRRLDEMTELIAGIEKEIALRKQQYEYCRERLLTFKRAG